ncbi:MAG: ATP synthase F1 subunit gamma [Cryomorphaceae bacterium]|jgi:F-type H+-transporting ATPase subunit gamma|nr:ATP synthase F1 subunit gamma [Cryomorphaceae bacterium]|tara:strand:- start:51 stop:914 length:864 start_codon:yes stop_codon:yes gene_type:complete
MANLKELRNRITSIGSTMKITSAMKMVSAAKLKKAQDAIVQMRPYASKLTEILQKASSTLDSSENAYGEVRDGNRVRLVVISSNRGLCGGFNSSVVKKAKSYMVANPGEYTIATVGKKAHDAFKNDSRKVSSNTALWDDISFEGAKQEAQSLMDGFVAGEFDKVVIVYNSFKNAAVQEPQAEQFLPIAMEEQLGTEEVVDNTEYIYEPSMQEILADLIPTSLKTQFFAALLDANASEHGARMTAMHKATDNAKALQGDLKLEYNKARQAAITNEILEIVGGADALAG